MDLGLADKTALITGGSKGIGLACAKALLAEGARVAICSRSQENIDKALSELPGAVGFTADLTDAAQASRPWSPRRNKPSARSTSSSTAPARPAAPRPMS